MKGDNTLSKSNDYYNKKPELGKRGPSKLRQQFNRGMTYFLVIAASIVFYFAFLRFTNLFYIFGKVLQVLKPILYGLVLAYLLNPIVKWTDRKLRPVLEKKVKKEQTVIRISRGVGIVAGLVILISLVVTLCNMIIPELYRSIRDMAYTVPGQINQVLAAFSEYETKDTTINTLLRNIMEEGSKSLQNWIRTDLLKQTNIIMSNLTVGVINIVSELMNVLIGIIVSVYVLFSKETFSGQCKKILYALTTPHTANVTLHITQKSNEIFGGFITGKIIDSAIIGVLCFFGLSILNMPYALLVSVIVGVTNIIPFFGPYIGAIPSSVLILLSDPKKGIIFIFFILALQQLDGNVIGPKILGDSTGLSAFWVVFAILVGGGLFGFPGMIMGVPTFAVIYYIAGMIINQKLEKKKLPTGSDCYDEYSYVNSRGEYIHSEQNIVWQNLQEEKEKTITEKIKETMDKLDILMEESRNEEKEAADAIKSEDKEEKEDADSSTK